jgi:hypothetical protein
MASLAETAFRVETGPRSLERLQIFSPPPPRIPAITWEETSDVQSKS